MRVISQNRDIDIDYESSNFYIDDELTIKAINNNMFYIMGTYSTATKASEALLGMSKMSSRCLLYTGPNAAMTHYDTFDQIESDKEFSKIEITPIGNSVYFFPKEEE